MNKENAKSKSPKLDSTKLTHYSEILKKPMDDNSLSLPQPVLEMIQKRFDLFVKSLLGLPYDLESDEVTRGKFVILCETFLHMYNTIFSPLEEYLQSKDIWKIGNNGIKNMADEYCLEHNFNVRLIKKLGFIFFIMTFKISGDDINFPCSLINRLNIILIHQFLKNIKNLPKD